MTLIREKDSHNYEDKRSNSGAEGRHSLEPEKAYLTNWKKGIIPIQFVVRL